MYIRRGLRPWPTAAACGRGLPPRPTTAACDRSLQLRHWAENLVRSVPLDPPPPGIDYRHGKKYKIILKSHIFLLLTVKFQFWSTPPYIFCGLAHWDVEKARKCAAEGLRLFLLQPRHELHHRLTWLVCVTWRDELDKFIAGDSLQNCCRPFQLLIARLLMVPIVERSIEAKHALAKIALQSSHMHGSAVRMSLSNRLPEFARQLQQNPSLFNTLLDCLLDECRIP